MEKGYIQVYTGNGKGKTSAAIGVAIRAIGRGKRVAMGQFIKDPSFQYSEMLAVEEINKIGTPLGYIRMEQFGCGCCIHQAPAATDFKGAREGLDRVKGWIESGEWDVVILDEINIALHLGLIPMEEVVEMLRNKPEKVEIIVTGRYAPKEIIEIADLVTEMKEIKHYYQKGILSREGIDR